MPPADPSAASVRAEHKQGAGRQRARPPRGSASGTEQAASPSNGRQGPRPPAPLRARGSPARPIPAREAGEAAALLRSPRCREEPAETIGWAPLKWPPPPGPAQPPAHLRLAPPPTPRWAVPPPSSAALPARGRLGRSSGTAARLRGGRGREQCREREAAPAQPRRGPYRSARAERVNCSSFTPYNARCATCKGFCQLQLKLRGRFMHWAHTTWTRLSNHPLSSPRVQFWEQFQVEGTFQTAVCYLRLFFKAILNSKKYTKLIKSNKSYQSHKWFPGSKESFRQPIQKMQSSLSGHNHGLSILWTHLLYSTGGGKLWRHNDTAGHNKGSCTGMSSATLMPVINSSSHTAAGRGPLPTTAFACFILSI